MNCPYISPHHEVLAMIGSLTVAVLLFAFIVATGYWIVISVRRVWKFATHDMPIMWGNWRRKRKNPGSEFM